MGMGDSTFEGSSVQRFRGKWCYMQCSNQCLWTIQRMGIGPPLAEGVGSKSAALLRFWVIFVIKLCQVMLIHHIGPYFKWKVKHCTLPKPGVMDWWCGLLDYQKSGTGLRTCSIITFNSAISGCEKAGQWQKAIQLLWDVEEILNFWFRVIL